MAAKLLLICLTICVLCKKVNSNLFFGDVNPSKSLAKCTAVCDEAYTLASNNVGRIDSCSRGCRFYGIAELVEIAQFNISKETCYNCCYESYDNTYDRAACNMGCDTMAKHQKEAASTVPDISWSILIEDGDSTQILQTGDMLEPDDVLTDLGLRRQLIVDAKLPEMKVKTLPVNIDEKVLGEENQRDWWADCTVKRAGMPRCFAASVLIFLVLLALWLGLSCDDKSIVSTTQAPPLPSKYSLLENVKV